MRLDGWNRRDGTLNQSFDEFRVSTDRSELDLLLIHRFLLEQSGWAQGIPIALVRKSLQHSLCFGGFIAQAQVAFARVVSDLATFGNLVDVFVVREHRGKGYGTRIVQAVISHPKLQGLRRFTLTTADAHRLYAQFGFTAPSQPETLMERHALDVYKHMPDSTR